MLEAPRPNLKGKVTPRKLDQSLQRSSEPQATTATITAFVESNQHPFSERLQSLLPPSCFETGPETRSPQSIGDRRAAKRNPVASVSRRSHRPCRFDKFCKLRSRVGRPARNGCARCGRGQRERRVGSIIGREGSVGAHGGRGRLVIHLDGSPSRRAQLHPAQKRLGSRTGPASSYDVRGPRAVSP